MESKSITLAITEAAITEAAGHVAYFPLNFLFTI